MAKSSKESQSKDKEKSLQSALSQIETQFGPGTIMRMGDREIQNIPGKVDEKTPGKCARQSVGKA